MLEETQYIMTLHILFSFAFVTMCVYREECFFYGIPKKGEQTIGQSYHNRIAAIVDQIYVVNMLFKGCFE